MKQIAVISALLLHCGIQTFSQTIPGDGSDGPFNPTGDITVDLSLAADGAWNANNAAAAGKGVYDPSRWAVVFKYSSVNIPEGVKVSFVNHPTHAPVVWLVSGNITIAGTLSIEGHSAAGDAIGRLTPSEPGPGGFRGGAIGPAGWGHAHGPGGTGGFGHGQYQSLYGNPQIIPLIGGSGSAGLPNTGWGAGGGGAILMAAAGEVAISGSVIANGGQSPNGNGSGGAVRIIAQTVSGNGQISALPDGRLRIETSALSPTLRTAPETVAVSPALLPIIWPADDAPTVRVSTVDGIAAPSDPKADLVSSSDMRIEKNSVVQVILETRNFPMSGVVELRSLQKYGPAGWVAATFVDGNFAASRWVANITFVPGFTTLQARATAP